MHFRPATFWATRNSFVACCSTCWTMRSSSPRLEAVSASALNCQKGQASVIVSDTGIGIAPEHLPRIFDRFYRVDSARSRRTGGNGLGLSICKSIAEAHQGSIEVVSQPGKGTQVTLTLPETTRSSPRVAELEALAVPGV